MAHDNPHFEWLIGHRSNLVDMSTPGALATRLKQLQGNRSLLKALRHPEEAKQRFNWAHLKTEYLQLYQQIASMKPPFQ